MWRRCVIGCALVACGRLDFTPLAVGDANPDGAGDGSDAAEVLKRAYVKASNSDFFARFGWALAMSTDGQTLAVTAPLDDGPLGLTLSGAVYVFVRTDDTWSEQAYLRADNAEMADVLGWSVALSGDGNTLAVGAPQEDSAATTINGNGADNMAPESGAVYVFVRTGTSWSQQAYIKGANTEGGDDFGHSVALSANGDVLAVGADLEDSAETGTSGLGASNAANGSGAAYVFRRAGTSWSQDAYLKASNTGIDDGFGFALALSGDGNLLVVGASGEDSGATTINGSQTDESVMSAGAAYAFVHDITWAQAAYLKPTSIDFGDFFGRVITVSRDGNMLAIASPGEDTIQPNSGAVFTFARTGPTTWASPLKLKAFTPGDNAQFGVSLALTTTGDEMFSGAPFHDDGGNDAGARYQHLRSTSWTEGALGKATFGDAGDNFGYSVASSDDGRTVAAGAPYEDSNANTINGDASNNDGMDNGCVEIDFR